MIFNLIWKTLLLNKKCMVYFMAKTSYIIVLLYSSLSNLKEVELNPKFLIIYQVFKIKKIEKSLELSKLMNFVLINLNFHVYMSILKMNK